MTREKLPEMESMVRFGFTAKLISRTALACACCKRCEEYDLLTADNFCQDKQHYSVIGKCTLSIKSLDIPTHSLLLLFPSYLNVYFYVS